MRRRAGIVALTVPVALGAALVAGSGCNRDAGAVRQAGDTLTAALSGLRIGDPVPNYRAIVLTGDSVEIGRQTDPVTLLNVWATWCASCREEMEDLEELHRAYAPRGVRVVAVSLDAGSEALVRRFVAHQQLTFPVVHDRQGRLQSLYRVGGVPSTYVVSGGRLIWQRTGGLHGSVDLARSALDSALATR